MNSLRRSSSSSLERFDPDKARRRDAEADAVIAYAKRVKDWPLLEQAVDVKIEDQTAFVGWWDAHVTPRQSPGRNAKKSIADPRLISRAHAEQRSGIHDDQVSRWRQRLADAAAYRTGLLGAAYRAAMLWPEHAHLAQGTGEEDWHTPADYIEAAREVLQAIDLDPASSAEAQRTVRAARFYSPTDDGLRHPWPGRVWLNPPYRRDAIGRFIAKLIEELTSGRTTAAILLTNNATDTEWFHAAERHAARLCFTLGRITFVNALHEAPAPLQGQTFFYYGPDAERFRAVFSAFGFVR